MESEEAILIEGYFDGIRPVKKLLVSDWANENIHLTSENSAEPGQYRTDRTPYLKKIMDVLSPIESVKRVVSMKGVQLGFTAAGLNVACCYIDIAATAIMYVMPTIELSRAISENRIDVMIENSPNLRKKVRPARERDSGNTKLMKKFPGGYLVLSGANSGPSLRSRSVQVLIMDEVDAYPPSVDDEGSPVSLAEKRTSTYGSRKKIFLLSTPLNQGVSVIENEYENTDKQKYYVPCPHCKQMQELKFVQLKWEKSKPETAKYECVHCNAAIEERHKPWMFSPQSGADWVVTRPEGVCEDKMGFHLNSLYSPLGWMSWADIADQWEKAQGDIQLLKVFVNTILAETWTDKGEAPPWEGIYDRREGYPMNKPPKGVVFITAGVDVQKDRLEVEIVGWCRDKRSYSLSYEVILGDTTGSEVWDKLREVVERTWIREDKVVLPLRLMAIDTGYNTNHVYDFCRKFDINKVIPIKGQDKQMVIISAPKQVDINISGKKVGKVRLFHVGVNLLKSELYGWLKQRIDDKTGEVPIGYCYFPNYGSDHFKGLCSEFLKPVKTNRGYIRYEWTKLYERNEQLDCRVYARAAASIAGMDRWNKEMWDMIDGKNYSQNVKTKTATQNQVKKPSFWDKKR